MLEKQQPTTSGPRMMTRCTDRCGLGDHMVRHNATQHASVPVLPTCCCATRHEALICWLGFGCRFCLVRSISSTNCWRGSKSSSILLCSGQNVVCALSKTSLSNPGSKKIIGLRGGGGVVVVVGGGGDVDSTQHKESNKDRNAAAKQRHAGR